MLNSHSIAKKKHSTIYRRAFKSYLDIFLICMYIKDKNLKNSITEDSFQSFHYNHPDIPKAIKAYQKSKDTDKFLDAKIKDLDEAIDKWTKNNKVLIADFRKIFHKNKFISYNSIKEFYGDDNHNRECHYCHITEKDIDTLIEKGKIITKRLSTRGRSMEVDQKDTNKGYEKGNIVLCCYWCNNAKTDEFTEKEFIPIGELIGETWKSRQ